LIDKINTCKFCIFMKHGTGNHGGNYSTEAESPGTHWACDTKQMHEDAYGYKHILVTIDMCSRWVYLRALKTVGGEEACSTLEGLIREHGTPALRYIRHDPGTQFIDKRVQQLLREHNIESVPTVAGNKQQNGMVERAIQTMRIQLAAQQWDSGMVDWSEALSATEEVLNKSKQFGPENTPKGVVSKEDDVWVEQDASWVLALRTDKKKLDILPRVWDGPYVVVSKTAQLVDIQDVAGNRSLVPISNTKPYRPEYLEDIEGTEVIMYNATSGEDPFYIVDRVLDHQPKHGITGANLKLRVLYKGYSEAEWYEARLNKDLLKTGAFAEYCGKFKEVGEWRLR